ncbi:hypothetical protein MRB53_041520 [Persea americana]|nr:hypothetical protein MRB53_041520 [Persea americana]
MLQYWTAKWHDQHPPHEEEARLLAAHIEIHSRRGRVEEASQAFEMIRSRSPEGRVLDLRCWYLMINAHLHKQDLVSAEKVLDQLIEQQDPKPDVKTILPLLLAHARDGRVARVQSLIKRYSQYLERGGDTTAVQCAILKAHVANKDIVTATTLLREKLIPASTNNLQGQLTSAFNIVLLALAKTARCSRNHAIIPIDGRTQSADRL